MSVEGVTVQWERIEACLQRHVLITDSSQPFFNPGASEEDIVQAESSLGVRRFPDDFRASLKRHNGQPRYEVVIGMGPLLSTTEIVTQWTVWKELLDAGSFDFDDDDDPTLSDPGVKSDWWNPLWIPITHDGGGNHDCVDMDPAEGGSVGQIVEMYHDDGVRPLKASSFLSWLTALAANLENGILVWEEGSGFFPKQHALTS